MRITAQVYALQGRVAEALGALRQAIDERWWGGQETWWMLESDPNLAALHGDPRFTAMIAEVNDELGRMRQSLERHPELTEDVAGQDVR